jgi:hypothetical protein
VKIKWEKENKKLHILKEDGDRPIYKDSTFWYKLVQVLRQEGHDVIYKCPEKDKQFGHMTSMDYYLRSRRPKKGVESFWLYWGNYNIETPTSVYRRCGEIRLTLECNIFDLKTKEKKYGLQHNL